MGPSLGLIATASDICGRDRRHDARRLPLERVETVEAFGNVLIVNGLPFVTFRKACGLTVTMAAKVISYLAAFRQSEAGGTGWPEGRGMSEGAILNGLDFLVHGARKVWVKPSVDPENLANAIAAFAHGVRRDDVVLLADASSGGNARYGLMATLDTLYGSGGDGRPRSMSLARPAETGGGARVAVTAEGTSVLADGAVLADLKDLGAETASAVAEALDFLARCWSGQAPVQELAWLRLSAERASSGGGAAGGSPK
jgi:hypothetical protein